MSKPMLSILVPVYKVEQYIHECIDSILAQTFTDFELILVDDGSPDRSGAICDEYEKKDNRVSVIHKENGGLISARKSGIEKASGEYVGFVDSDDWIDADMYAMLCKRAIETDADIVSSGHIHEKGATREYHGAQQDFLYVSGKEIREDLLTTFLMHQTEREIDIRNIYTNSLWSKIYKRTLLTANISFWNDKAVYGEDMLLNFIVLLNAKKVTIIGNSYCYHYVSRQGSMMNCLNEKRWEEVKARCEAIVNISQMREYHSTEVDICLGWLVYNTIKQFLHSNDNFGRKRQILRNIMKENPVPRQFNLFKKHCNSVADKTYIYLISGKMYGLVILLMRFYDAVIKGRNEDIY